MKRSNDMNTYFKPKPTLLASAMALVFAAGPAAAVDYFLCAGVTNKALPDGNSVPMWGFAEDDDGDLSNGCGNPVTVPGPRLTVPAADNLTINLRNDLPEPTSIVIPGLPMPTSAGAGPTWDGGAVGARTNPDQRVRSFGAETAAGGGLESYSWAVGRPGTFLYHSGTHPQKQVYMGLYGAVTKNTPAGEAYAGVPYDNEVMLFFSEIDPDLNAAVAGGTHATSIHYHAKWFLVNGEPYSTACTDNGAGFDLASGYPCANMVQTPEIDAGLANTRTLLRFLSAAGETHVPTLQGMHMSIHAEDGNPYTWQDGATVMGAAPREQYSLMLPPLKTKDAIIEAPIDGRYALYDGNGYMTNPTSPNDFDHGDPIGGMLRFLRVGPGSGGNQPPIATDDPGPAASITVVEGRSITIDVLANDSDPEGQPLTINSFTAATVGTVVCDTANPGGTCDYTAAGPGTGTFDYDVTDGVNVSAPATVSVTVEANQIPVAVDDTGDTLDQTTPVVINVLDNDTDANGDALTIDHFDLLSANGADVSCDNATGDCTYTPDGVFIGDDTFTYTATDGDASSLPATVTVTVNGPPPNSAPVATDDAYDIGEAGLLAGNVLTDDTGLGPDSDVDGDPLTAAQVGADPANAALFTFDSDGSFSYRSTPDFNGQDTFTYVANDGTDDSLVATVTIDVTEQNDVPVANPDTFFLMSMGTWSEPADGVLANDTDADADPLTATIDLDPNRGTVALAADGSFDYDPEPGDDSVGTMTTFTYVANDGNADSAPATVTLERKLSVREAICERRNNGNCNWRIEGLKATGASQRVEAWLLGAYPGTGFCNRTQRNAGNCIRSASTADGVWNINRNNRTFNSTLGPIDFRVNGDPDAEIKNYTDVTEN